MSIDYPRAYAIAAKQRDDLESAMRDLVEASGDSLYDRGVGDFPQLRRAIQQAKSVLEKLGPPPIGR